MSLDIPHHFRDEVKQRGESLLASDLDDIGLKPGFLKRGRITKLGQFYGLGGVVLRIAQTSSIRDEAFDRLDEHPWPFDRSAALAPPG